MNRQILLNIFIAISLSITKVAFLYMSLQDVNSSKDVSLHREDVNSSKDVNFASQDVNFTPTVGAAYSSACKAPKTENISKPITKCIKYKLDPPEKNIPNNYYYTRIFDEIPGNGIRYNIDKSIEDDSSSCFISCYCDIEGDNLVTLEYVKALDLYPVAGYSFIKMNSIKTDDVVSCNNFGCFIVMYERFEINYGMVISNTSCYDRNEEEAVVSWTLNGKNHTTELIEKVIECSNDKCTNNRLVYKRQCFFADNIGNYEMSVKYISKNITQNIIPHQETSTQQVSSNKDDSLHRQDVNSSQDVKSSEDVSHRQDVNSSQDVKSSEDVNSSEDVKSAKNTTSKLNYPDPLKKCERYEYIANLFIFLISLVISIIFSCAIYKSNKQRINNFFSKSVRGKFANMKKSKIAIRFFNFKDSTLGSTVNFKKRCYSVSENTDREKNDGEIRTSTTLKLGKEEISVNRHIVKLSRYTEREVV